MLLLIWNLRDFGVVVVYSNLQGLVIIEKKNEKKRKETKRKERKRKEKKRKRKEIRPKEKNSA